MRRILTTILFLSLMSTGCVSTLFLGEERVTHLEHRVDKIVETLKEHDVNVSGDPGAFDPEKSEGHRRGGSILSIFGRILSHIPLPPPFNVVAGIAGTILGGAAIRKRWGKGNGKR